MKRKIFEESFIECSCTSYEQIIESLNTTYKYMKAIGVEPIGVSCHEDEISLYGHRLETDDEYNTRILREQRQKAKEINARISRENKQKTNEIDNLKKLLKKLSTTNPEEYSKILKELSNER